MNQNSLKLDYLDTYIELKERIQQAQYNSYSAVNSEMILAYLDIGKVISERTLTTSQVAQYTMLFKDEYHLSFLNLSDHHSEKQF